MEGMIIQHPAGRITLEVWRPSFHPRSFWVEHGEHFKRRAWLPIDSWVEPSELHIQEYIYVHQQDSATSLNNVTGTSYPPSNMIFLLLTARVSPFDKETAAAKQVFRFLHRAGTDTIMEIASWCREHVPRKGALYVTLTHHICFLGRNLHWARHKGIPYWHNSNSLDRLQSEDFCWGKELCKFVCLTKANSCQWMRHLGAFVLCRGPLQIYIMSLARSELSIKMQQNGPMSNGRNNVKQLIFYWFPAFSGMDARRRCCWSSLGSQMPIRARSQDGRSHLGCNMHWMIEGYNWWKALECCVKRGWSRVPDEFRWTFSAAFDVFLCPSPH